MTLLSCSSACSPAMPVVRPSPAGHASLLHVEDMPRKIDVVGTTLDDAAGECFDKVARLLGFPYPGGPHIDRPGQERRPARHHVLDGR